MKKSNSKTGTALNIPSAKEMREVSEKSKFKSLDEVVKLIRSQANSGDTQAHVYGKRLSPVSIHKLENLGYRFFHYGSDPRNESPALYHTISWSK